MEGRGAGDSRVHAHARARVRVRMRVQGITLSHASLAPISRCKAV